MCFDNIRLMRSSNSAMVDTNDDNALSDQFDETLSTMISNMTEQLQVQENSVERGKIVISGKRDLMQLFVDKTLEYHRAVDPLAELVLSELATQYELLVDQALNLIAEGTSGSDKD